MTRKGNWGRDGASRGRNAGRGQFRGRGQSTYDGRSAYGGHNTYSVLANGGEAGEFEPTPPFTFFPRSPYIINRFAYALSNNLQAR
jgi:hypothetical protein